MARALRVAALTDAPAAFGSTLAREQSLDEAAWRARLSGGAWFAALLPPAADVRSDVVGVGLACGTPADDPRVRRLTAMWVAPAERGSGVADALVDRVLDWARGDGGNSVQLWVVATNVRAISVYERHGFGLTGAHHPLESDPSVLQVEMTTASLS